MSPRSQLVQMDTLITLCIQCGGSVNVPASGWANYKKQTEAQSWEPDSSL